MTQCCNDFGNCTQGRDCPVRKQRQQETNEAYIKGHKDEQLDKPYEDMAATFVAEAFKGLVYLIGVVAGAMLLAYVIWGK